MNKTDVGFVPKTIEDFSKDCCYDVYGRVHIVEFLDKEIVVLRSLGGQLYVKNQELLHTIDVKVSIIKPIEFDNALYNSYRVNIQTQYKLLKHD